MGLKETYEKMWDDELLERYKDFYNYNDNAKLVMLTELKKRELISDKAFQMKSKSCKKIKTEDKEIDSKVKEKIVIRILKIIWKYFFSSEKIKIYEKKGLKSEKDWGEKYTTLHNRNMTAFALKGINKILLILIVYSILIFPTIFFSNTTATVISTDENFKYEYTIDNKKYTSDQLCAFESIISITEEDKINEKKQKYSKGDQIQIYYSPFDFHYSVIEIGISIMLFKGFLIAVLGQFFGMYVTLGTIYYRTLGWIFLILIEGLLTLIKLGRI